MSEVRKGRKESNLRRSYALMHPYRGRVFLTAFMVVCWTGTVLAGPMLIRFGIDEGIKKSSASSLNLAICLYLLVALLGYVFYRVQVYFMGLVGERFLSDLRIRVFSHLQRLSMTFYDREKAGVIVSRMTSDIEALSELTQTGLVMFISNAVLLVFSLIVLSVVSWQLMLVCTLTLPLVAIATVRFARKSSVAFLTLRDRIGDTLSQLQEGISGVRVIQAFAREDHQVDRFSNRNVALYDAHVEAARISAWYTPVVEFCGLASTALVVGIGGWLVGEDAITIGTITFFVLTLQNLFEPIQQLANIFTQVQSANAGLKKVFELLDTPVDCAESSHPVDLPESGILRVQNLNFAYDDKVMVLSDINLELGESEKLALVGPTGAGKSTLAKLMARLYDPLSGAVSFGNIDLREARTESLRERIVVVPQEGFLLNASIIENIRLARPSATDQEVVSALEAIGVHERFAELEDGLETRVNERGARLSAGERQLISIARAALADPVVLVLDEATSSLDPGTEMVIELAMEKLMEGRATVVIAHRLSTAERADRIGVVADGRLVQLGSHSELVRLDGPYALLYETWTTGLSGSESESTEI